MTGDYFVSTRARWDLDQIWDYIALGSPAAADRLLDALCEKFEVLAANPLIGEACDHLRPGLRRFPVRRYVIYYSIDESGLWIERVLHGARDAEAIFRNNGR